MKTYIFGIKEHVLSIEFEDAAQIPAKLLEASDWVAEKDSLLVLRYWVHAKYCKLTHTLFIPTKVTPEVPPVKVTLDRLGKGLQKSLFDV